MPLFLYHDKYRSAYTLNVLIAYYWVMVLGFTNMVEVINRIRCNNYMYTVMRV